jgi:chaperone required for assembly of F1-ATPase
MISPKGESDNRPHRFYADVDIAPHETGFAVRLDARLLRTPEKKPLAMPTRELAEFVASEWRSQQDRIDFASMWATRLANVVIDRTPHVRAALADEVARYAATDLVCYLVDHPPELRARQDREWDPLRAWASEAMGLRLSAGVGVRPILQPGESLAAAHRHAADLDDFRLTALVHAVALFGSAVLGFAVERGRVSAVDAFDLSRLDEAFQAERWGEDDEAVRRTERSREEARLLDLWFAAL